MDASGQTGVGSIHWTVGTYWHIVTLTTALREEVVFIFWIKDLVVDYPRVANQSLVHL